MTLISDHEAVGAIDNGALPHPGMRKRGEENSSRHGQAHAGVRDQGQMEGHG